ncbi:Bug family tripartite tricarboxylate transporter substrate binding protein [Paracraurococcus lichenis]|uniref:Tripartite tricarboxylate transporter substrate binding protein n=1 Tax=Paracraurococcus lichenis TaxID=3064888 RepID=A0ABT9DWW9_9PROT|nr:tripartite tricarboxylate transporter substrate binding protein [Paracraurococcus sp. LOR1-02]MDO9708387.1 tripartite tricarboxylate transporter substrate binding protein [Paracraurococcus sp. LOR1-02]
MRSGSGLSRARPGRRALLAAPALLMAGRALAAWPDHPVRLFVGFPPGGPTDFIARAVAPGLQAAWGQPVVIENRGGANATIATEAVARAAPDGHTLLLAANNHVMNPPLYAKLPYDPVVDFAPVHAIAVSPNVLWCGTQQPWRSLAELIAEAKARPGAIGVATTGIGGNGHYGMELLQRALGIQLTHVPYRGTAPAMQDVVAGLVPLTAGTLVGTIGPYRNGQLRPLAVLSPQRAPELPDVPTTAELGWPLVDTGVWYGLLAPAATPPALVQRMAADMAALLATREVEARLASQASIVLPLGPEEFAARIRDDLRAWAEVARAAGMKAE